MIFFVFVILRNVQRIMFIGNFLQCCKLFWISTDFITMSDKTKINDRGFFDRIAKVTRRIMKWFKKLITHIYKSNYIRNQLSVNEQVKICLFQKKKDERIHQTNGPFCKTVAGCLKRLCACFVSTHKKKTLT